MTEFIHIKRFPFFAMPKKVKVVPLDFNKEFAQRLEHAMKNPDGVRYTIEAMDGSRRVTFSVEQHVVVKISSPLLERIKKALLIWKEKRRLYDLKQNNE